MQGHHLLRNQWTNGFRLTKTRLKFIGVIVEAFHSKIKGRMKQNEVDGVKND